jgi:hypothetical protein
VFTDKLLSENEVIDSINGGQEMRKNSDAHAKAQKK